MPYITQDRRQVIDNRLREVVDVLASEGELNYAITRLAIGFLPNEPRYSDYNSVMGVLESAKQEFYRRLVVGYEDGKIQENGDVY